MFDWQQIHRDYPLRALLAGWCYLCWLRALRWARHARQHHAQKRVSDRHWVWCDMSGEGHLVGRAIGADPLDRGR